MFADKGYRPISARVITDKNSGQSRGFGFVEFGPGEDTAQAIGELDGLDVEGRAIIESEARHQEFAVVEATGSGGRSGRGRRGY